MRMRVCSHSEGVFSLKQEVREVLNYFFEATTNIRFDGRCYMAESDAASTSLVMIRGCLNCKIGSLM